MESKRVIIVSNRLPVTVSEDENGRVFVAPSSGGLATAMSHVHAQSAESLWIGWPGPVALSEEQEKGLLHPLRCVGVRLTAGEVTSFYDNFSNGVLWPLCHYLLDKVLLDVQSDWQTYCAVNQKFAQTILEQAKEDDVVWIHDYQLMMVPAMVRLQAPNMRIGYFHHIPFPSADVFKTLPWRRQILEGLLGANVIGFHTASYAHNFSYSCSALLGSQALPDNVTVDNRVVSVAAFPIGIDSESFAARAASQVSRPLNRVTFD